MTESAERRCPPRLEIAELTEAVTLSIVLQNLLYSRSRSAGDLGDFGDHGDTSTEGALVERPLSGTFFPNSWQLLRMTEPTWL